MFSRILIANRGEIACRIMRTARELSITCVAIYSEADKNALHVRCSDEAYNIGPAPSQDSYLNIEKIIQLAKKAQVDAIHPGYGFLSENAHFANACEQANIIFIGPKEKTIADMGSKAKAKAIMQKAGIPILAAWYGQDQTQNNLVEQAQRLGFPLLLKPSAGGGGKGMRIVHSIDELKSQLTAVKRQAKASFNDSEILLEQYLSKARHVEVQILADQWGHCIHLFDRDCSIQRRYQKIIEEAPAPQLVQQLHLKIGQTAVEVGQAIQYIGAGTVEFLVDQDHQFYFMEMNTRLQVEHPITEMITGEDLVAWQIKIAAGEPLTLQQADIHPQGHAIEARVYAETPQKDFLPASGTISYLQQPTEGKHLRIDSGIKNHDQVSIHYDPMLAKIIVCDKNRARAIHRLQHALAHYHLLGISTNVAFLQALSQHPAFVSGDIDTSFVVHHQKALLQQLTLPPEAIALVSAYVLSWQKQQSHCLLKDNADAYSPWCANNSWQMNLPARQTLQFNYASGKTTVHITVYHAHHYQIQINEQINFDVTNIVIDNNHIQAQIGNKTLKTTVVQHNNQLTIFHCEGQFNLELINPLGRYAQLQTEVGQLNAPMPGTIVALLKKQGDKVKQGDSLLTIEAMKMEHTIYAPIAGIIETIYHQLGDQVEEGTELVSLLAEQS